MTNVPVHNLLSQVNSLLSRYERINELTGDNFNVFQILKVESSEVRMHSAFLAELLNPSGSHGQHGIFLRLFIERFCFKGNLIDEDHAQVFVEKNIGSKSDDETTAGRLDISIRDKNDNFIVIENKIYAADQPKQLERYRNRYPKADLFYLTLDGCLPSLDSKGALLLDEDFKCLSYEIDILDWLVACRKEVATLPMVREALSHYINLIKYLTNQTTNQQMNEELNEIMKQNLRASFAIAGNLNHSTQIIATDFARDLKSIMNERGLECDCNINFRTNFTGIWIYRPEWKYFKIGFQFQSRNHSMIYGFTIRTIDDGNPIFVDKKLISNLNALPNNDKRHINSAWWPWFNNMESEFGDWNKPQAFEAIFDGRMAKFLVERTDLLLEMADGIEL